MVCKTSGEVNDDQLFQQMASSLVKIVAPDRMADWLRHWGFVWWTDAAPPGSQEHAFRVKVMGRYAMAIGKAALRAVLEERVKLEKDRVEHERSRKS